MSRWFRMYSDVLDDPKVQRLPAPLFKVWVNLLCLASRNDGALPGVEDIAFALRLEDDVAAEFIRQLTERGLLDSGDVLSPHNWDNRQFKSDHDETAAERQRKKRARDKDAPVTRDADENVTRDIPVTSHPPEQSRTDTEQSRAEQTQARAEDPPHWKVAQDALKDRLPDLDDWEIDFLHSIKWKPSLTAAQRDSLRAIEAKLSAKGDKPQALPSVKRGTPAYDAWVAHYRRKSRTGRTFHERLDVFTVPSEFPPMETAA